MHEINSSAFAISTETGAIEALLDLIYLSSSQTRETSSLQSGTFAMHPYGTDMLINLFFTKICSFRCLETKLSNLPSTFKGAIAWESSIFDGSGGFSVD